MNSNDSVLFGPSFILLLLSIPVLIGLIVAVFDPAGAAEAINAKCRSVVEYYERTRGQSGFFLRWTLRPALWINARIFQATEEMTAGEHWKAAIRLVSAIYLCSLVVTSMYFLVSLILGVIFIGIGYLIVAHFMDWPRPRLGNLVTTRPVGPYPGDASKTRTREDIFGNRYREHQNKEGDVSGESRRREDWAGRPYAEHKDEQGNKRGETRAKEDIFGNSYQEHRDEQDNVTGTSREREDIFGRAYTEHKDADGNVVGESRDKEDWLGKPYTEHQPKD